MFPVRLNRRNWGGPPATWNGGTPFDRATRMLGLLDDEVLAGTRRDFAVDIREDRDHYFIEANLPGVRTEDVNVTVDDGVLTLSAKREAAEQGEGERYHVRERAAGEISRSFRLPSEVDVSKIEALLAGGVLSVTLHKAEAAKPRRIPVAGE